MDHPSTRVTPVGRCIRGPEVWLPSRGTRISVDNLPQKLIPLAQQAKSLGRQQVEAMAAWDVDRENMSHLNTQFEDLVACWEARVNRATRLDIRDIADRMRAVGRDERVHEYVNAKLRATLVKKSATFDYGKKLD